MCFGKPSSASSAPPRFFLISVGIQPQRTRTPLRKNAIVSDQLTMSRCSRVEAQKDSHAIQLRLEFALEVGIVSWLRFDIAKLRLELPVLH